MMLELVKNPDFFHEVPDRLIKVAFAAETENLIENARRKPLSHGRLDLICANDVSAADSGFGVDTNRVTLIEPAGEAEELPLLTKYEVGHRILDRVARLLAARD
jgi:phosphopantothenoylcysteine decarboxylase/phosphopantothenate--cysteine ligase